VRGAARKGGPYRDQRIDVWDGRADRTILPVVFERFIDSAHFA
jgi:hypothetical protein